MTINNQQERRALNDGIEDQFMETAEYAAGIRTYYKIRRGVIKDLFELFYFNLAYLIELTEGLEELSKDKTSIEDVNRWLDGLGNTPSEMEIREGLNVFKKFKRSMSARGLLSLPSGRRS